MHSKEVEDRIELDILLANIIRHLELDLNPESYQYELVNMYIESLVHDCPDIHLEIGTIAITMSDIMQCSDKTAIEVLDML